MADKEKTNVNSSFDSIILDRISDGFLSLDKHWNYVFVNKKAGELLGKVPDSLIGKCLWDEFPEAKNKLFYANYKKAFENQEFCSFKEYYPPWDKWFENRVYPSNDGISVYFTDITAQVNAERISIKELEKFQLYKTFLDSSYDSFQVANEEGYLVFANEVALNRLGINASDLYDVHVVDFEDSFNTLDDWRTHVTDLKREHTIILQSTNTNLKSGELIPIEVTINYETIDGVGYVIAVSRDISQRINTENKLTENISFTQDILDSMNDGFSMLDIDGKQLKINSAFAKMFGFKESELIGCTPPHPYWPIEYYDEIYAAFEKTKQGFQGNFQLHFQRKSGEIFPVIVSPSQIKNATGITTKYVATVKDVSDLYKAQNLVQESEQRMSAILETSGLGIWDYDLITQETTRTFQHDYCFGLKELHPNWNYETFINFVHEDDKEKVNAVYPTYLDKGKPYNIDYRVRWEDGSIHWLNSAGKGFYDVNHNLIRVIGIVQDITTRKENELKVQESNKENETLLAEIHHRVKNNLAVVAGLMYLQTKDTDNQDLIDRLTINIDRIKSIASIHEELYKSHNYSRISFSSTIKKVVENLRTVSYNNKSVDIDFDLDNVFLKMNDALPAALIVNELVTNSFKHAFEGVDSPKISIELTISDELIHLIIKDNGNGLPKNYQPNTSLSIGLNLVRSLAEQIDASLDFKNEKGLVCTLSFKSIF